MFVAAACALALLAGCNNGGEKTAQTPPSVAGASIGTLNWAVSTPWRIQPERDKYRHPMQTLSFFGVRNDATVIEISPGAGWYTSILAPYIKEGGGRFIVATFDPANATPQQKTALDDFKKRFVDKPEIFGQIEMVPFSKTSGTLGPDNSADFVLTFRNVHNFMMAGYAEKAFRDFHAVLKPGGILGVEEHRLPEGKEQDPLARTGYVADTGEPKDPAVIWTSRTLAQDFDYLGLVKSSSWTYQGALDRLVEGGRELRADAVVDVHFERVGFLKTMQAFAIKYK